jgi:hypothetical protein
MPSVRINDADSLSLERNVRFSEKEKNGQNNGTFLLLFFTTAASGLYALANKPNNRWVVSRRRLALLRAFSFELFVVIIDEISEFLRQVARRL